MKNSTKPSIIFAMKYDNQVGYVWKTIRAQYEIAASQLSNFANCYISYSKLIKNTTNSSSALTEIELDLYSYDSLNKKTIKKKTESLNVKTIVFMSALPTSIDLDFIHKLGVRTVNTEHDGFDHNFKQSLIKKVSKFIVRRILKKQIHTIHVANCKSQGKWLQDHAQIPSERMKIVMNGVDSNEFYPGSKDVACEDVQLDKNKFWVLLASQARPEKRVDKVIQVAAEIRNEHPELNIGFIFVGGGDRLASWQELANSLNLSSDFFVFAGEQTKLRPYYQAASLFIHASERESFGLVLVEAMLCGLPVVATSANGPREIIEPNVTGFIVGQNDFEDFKQKIIQYVTNSEVCRLHGNNALKHAQKNFCIKKNSASLAGIIKSTLVD